MKPIQFSEANQNNEHGDLPCFVYDKGVICCWALSLKERIKVLLTGRVWMSVIGGFVPSISLLSATPFVRIAVKKEALAQSVAGVGHPEEQTDEP